uniref:Uncharacterized protein n=1 Tax=Bionectria ochroleuca TaxID=29856 RepID=A0A0B7KE52_BIOOC
MSKQLQPEASFSVRMHVYIGYRVDFCVRSWANEHPMGIAFVKQITTLQAYEIKCQQPTESTPLLASLGGN